MDLEKEEFRDTCDVEGTGETNGSDTASSALPQSLLRNTNPTIKVTIPPEGHGRYLKENDNIELPHILTVEQVREVIGQKDPKSESAQRAVMTMGWYYLTELDEEGVFAEPVMMPNYLYVIKYPMDLATVKLKLQKGKYKTIAEFSADVTLMLYNCLLFGEEGSELCVWAEYLLFAWHLCKQNIESVLRGDPSLAVQLLPPHTIGSNEEVEEDDKAGGDNDGENSGDNDGDEGSAGGSADGVAGEWFMPLLRTVMITEWTATLKNLNQCARR